MRLLDALLGVFASYRRWRGGRWIFEPGFYGEDLQGGVTVYDRWRRAR